MWPYFFLCGEQLARPFLAIQLARPCNLLGHRRRGIIMAKKNSSCENTRDGKHWAGLNHWTCRHKDQAWASSHHVWGSRHFSVCRPSVFISQGQTLSLQRAPHAASTSLAGILNLLVLMWGGFMVRWEGSSLAHGWPPDPHRAARTTTEDKILAVLPPPLMW